jgi:hypothetical protein
MASFTPGSKRSSFTFSADPEVDITSRSMSACGATNLARSLPMAK